MLFFLPQPELHGRRHVSLRSCFYVAQLIKIRKAGPTTQRAGGGQDRIRTGYLPLCYGYASESTSCPCCRSFPAARLRIAGSLLCRDGYHPPQCSLCQVICRRNCMRGGSSPSPSANFIPLGSGIFVSSHASKSTRNISSVRRPVSPTDTTRPKGYAPIWIPAEILCGLHGIPASRIAWYTSKRDIVSFGILLSSSPNRL